MKERKTKSASDQDRSQRRSPAERPEDHTPDTPKEIAEEAKPGPEAQETPVPEEASKDRPTVEQLEERVEALRDSLLRAKADYKNLERRSMLERTEAICYANGELMRSLLGVLDDLERSLVAMEESESRAPALDGVRLVYDNFLKALRTHGLEPIEALHQAFDPQLHEALMQQPSTDHEPGTVLEEVARGYRLRDRVLRPTKVVVSKAAEVERADEGDSNGLEKPEFSKKEEDELEAKT